MPRTRLRSSGYCAKTSSISLSRTSTSISGPKSRFVLGQSDRQQLESTFDGNENCFGVLLLAVRISVIAYNANPLPMREWPSSSNPAFQVIEVRYSIDKKEA